MMPASRLGHLRPSPIRALSEGAPASAIPMGLGEPGWALPEPGRLAFLGIEGPCAYGPNAGLPELREAVAQFHGEHLDRVMLATGSQGALFALFQAWLEPGDAVLVPDPGFLSYPALAHMAGATPLPYSLDANFRLDAEAFCAALDQAPRAKMAIINHPANPTGAGASREALTRVAEACEKRGILLISDEVYRELYLGERPASLREVTQSGLVLGSVSKAWGGPGLRLGWALGDPKWLAPARLLHAYMVTAPAAPAQRAALALIRESATVLPAARQEIRTRWNAFEAAYRTHFQATPALASGGFYHWLKVPEAAQADPMAFCLRLRDEGGVVVVPGSAFGEGGRHHIRLSFAGQPEAIAEGIRRLAPYWRQG
ncbi:MAG: pyridoxal phosphate-dependent aminotransferase [Holophagaceae bacterium]|nr:pyridoxal phosphate-dependent aminotransferase [Holophagaceae bacterium]